MRTVHWEVHTSPGFGTAAPSHSSPVSTTPSPHDATVHVVRHASGVRSELPGPSSHSSLPSTTPLPQVSSEVQVALQPSPSVLLPSSHTSVLSSTLSPQVGSAQLA